MQEIEQIYTQYRQDVPLPVQPDADAAPCGRTC